MPGRALSTPVMSTCHPTFHNPCTNFNNLRLPAPNMSHIHGTAPYLVLESNTPKPTTLIPAFPPNLSTLSNISSSHCYTITLHSNPPCSLPSDHWRPTKPRQLKARTSVPFASLITLPHTLTQPSVVWPGKWCFISIATISIYPIPNLETAPVAINSLVISPLLLTKPSPANLPPMAPY